MRGNRVPGERPGYRGRHIRPALPGVHRTEPSDPPGGPNRWYFLGGLAGGLLAFAVVIGFHLPPSSVFVPARPPGDTSVVPVGEVPPGVTGPAATESLDELEPRDPPRAGRDSRSSRIPGGPRVAAPDPPATSTNSPPGAPLVAATPTVCPPPLPIAPPATTAPKGRGKPSKSPKVHP